MHDLLKAEWKLWPELSAEIDRDPFISTIKSELEKGQSNNHFSLHQGQLFFKNMLVIVIPKKSPLIPKILTEFHYTPIRGHSGELKTYKRVVAELFWEGMRHDITQFVQSCQICQQNKSLTTSPAGLLQPIPLPQQVWDEVTMDFVEGLPTSDGWNTIFVVADRLKIWPFYATQTPFYCSNSG